MWHRNTMTGLPLADRFLRTAKKVTTFTHWWTIENFRFHPSDKDIESPPFSAGLNDGVEWKFLLYPDGANEKRRGFISLYLKMVSCIANEASVTLKISIFNDNHESKATMQSEEPRIFTLEGSGWDWGRVIERERVLSSINFPNGTLIVRSEISYAAEGVPPGPSLNNPFPPGMPEFESSADYRELLRSGLFSDVVFNVCGKEFRAHKAILATRSHAFKTLFEQNFGNLQPTRVEIQDADDHTFSELLELIYSGNESFKRIQNLLSEVAAQGQATSTTDAKDVKKEKDTSLTGDSTASTVSVLESIDNGIARAGHLGIGQTQTAALSPISSFDSAASLRSQRNEPSKSEFPTEEPIRTEEVTDKSFSESIEMVLPSESNEDIQDEEVRGSGFGRAERVQAAASMVVVRPFDGDESQFFEWWRAFKVQVHDRRDLSPSHKLVGLLIALEGETREWIDTAECEECQYFGTLDGLFIRYGSIEALPPGMFALMIVRRRNFSAMPLCIVENRMLMEQIEKIHRDPNALESVEWSEIKNEGQQKDSDSSSYAESGCQCQASNSSENLDDASMQRKKSNCVVTVEQQLEKLESVFAETQSPDRSTLESLAEKIGLTPGAIQMWFRLRPID